jgi:hypothetical protein
VWFFTWKFAGKTCAPKIFAQFASGHNYIIQINLIAVMLLHSHLQGVATVSPCRHHSARSLPAPASSPLSVSPHHHLPLNRLTSSSGVSFAGLKSLLCVATNSLDRETPAVCCVDEACDYWHEDNTSRRKKAATQAHKFAHCLDLFRKQALLESAAAVFCGILIAYALA